MSCLLSLEMPTGDVLSIVPNAEISLLVLYTIYT